MKRYFQLWNTRDIDSIMELFSPDVAYEDGLYAQPFRGREALHSHLTRAGNALPRAYVFVVDDMAEDAQRGRCAVRFHLESTITGNTVPFSKGISFFTLQHRTDGNNGWWLTSGYDLAEPLLKPGNWALWLAGLAGSLQRALFTSRSSVPKK